MKTLAILIAMLSVGCAGDAGGDGHETLWECACKTRDVFNNEIVETESMCDTSDPSTDQCDCMDTGGACEEDATTAAGPAPLR